MSPVLGSSDAESRTGPGLPPCLSPGADPHLLPVSDPFADVFLSDPDVTRVSDHSVLSSVPDSESPPLQLSSHSPCPRLKYQIINLQQMRSHSALRTDGNIDVSFTQLHVIKFLVGNCAFTSENSAFMFQ